MLARASLLRVLRAGAVAPAFAVFAAACSAPPSPGSIAVVTSWPGARTSDVERGVTAPIEDAVAGVAGVSSLVSSSAPGVSMVVAVVEPKQSVLHVADGIRTAVERAQTSLPQDVFAPTIIRREHGMRVVARYALTSSMLPRSEVTRIAGEMARSIERMPGVAEVVVKNGAHREIEVRVDAARAKALNVTPAAVADVLRGYPAKNIVDLAAVPVVRVPEVHVSDVATIAEDVVDDDAARSPAIASGASSGGASGAASGAASGVAPVILEVTQQAGAAPALPTPAAPSPAVDVKAVPLDDETPLAVVITGLPSGGGAPSADDFAQKARALVENNMAGNAGFHWTTPSIAPARRSENAVEIDRDRAAALGIGAADASAALRLALAGEIVVRIDDVPVRVSQPIDEHAPLGAQVFVPTRTGGLIALADVARETMQPAVASIARVDRERAVVLCGAVKAAGANAGAVGAARDAVTGRLKALSLPTGARVVVVDDAAAVNTICTRLAP